MVILQAFVDFMNGLPSIPYLVLISLAVEPVLVLAHELGHAVAALARLRGPVVVRVGGFNPLAVITFGRLTLQLSPLVVPWRFAGVCAHESRTTRLDAMIIALAGPFASLLAGLALGAAAHAVAPSVLHTVLFVAAFIALGSGVICLTPMTLTDSRGRKLRTDGAQALATLRVSR